MMTTQAMEANVIPQWIPILYDNQGPEFTSFAQKSDQSSNNKRGPPYT